MLHSYRIVLKRRLLTHLFGDTAPEWYNGTAPIKCIKSIKRPHFYAS